LWTIGNLVIGYIYKDRLIVEIMETLYKLRDKGKDVSNFNARDILIKQVFFCCKSRRTNQINKAILAGKKRLNVMFDIKK
jgi:hypothetical protein